MPPPRSLTARMADDRKAALRARLTAGVRRHHADADRAVDALLDVISDAEAGVVSTLVLETTPNGRIFVKPLRPRTQ